jgi:hypothetical protein
VKQPLIKTAVRLRFRLTSRDRASRQARQALADYLALGATVSEATGRRPTRIPPLLGIDEDMRDWSFYMILAHNVIVNRAIRLIVRALVEGAEPRELAGMNPRRDVMPAASAGPEQVAAFQSSVEDYLAAVVALPRLRGTPTWRHPVFDQLDAHGWHCMFALHLQIHLRQAAAVLRGRPPDR